MWKNATVHAITKNSWTRMVIVWYYTITRRKNPPKPFYLPGAASAEDGDENIVINRFQVIDIVSAKKVSTSRDRALLYMQLPGIHDIAW